MAIAFDAASTGRKNANDTAALTVAHTCTGTDLILWVGVAAGQGDLISTVTYNGVAMTQAVKKTSTNSNTNYLYLYYLINPATGANNIVVTPSGSTYLELCAASYTGAKQSGQPDNTASAENNASTTSMTATLTPVVSNCWAVTYGGLQRALTAGTGVTQRGSSGALWGTALGDSNGTISGSTSQTWTFSAIATGNQSQVMASFAPSVASTTPASTLLLMGV